MQTFLLTLFLAPPSIEPTFTASSTDDEQPSGQLVRFTRGLEATLRSPNGVATIANVVSLRRVGSTLPPFPTGPRIVTTAGDRIAGTLIGGDRQSLRFLPSASKLKPAEAWKVPLSSVVVLWLTDSPAQTPLDTNRYDWLMGVKNLDVLRFRNGDIGRGTIDGLDPDARDPTLSFRPERGSERSIAARELVAAALNPTLARTRKPKGAFARVILIDGSRLAMANAAVEGAQLSGTTLFGQKVQLPLASVVAIDIAGGKAVYLSDLKPRKVEQSGFLGVSWPWTPDRSVRGTALRIKLPAGETTADKGLGMHPRTLLTYDLGGKYRRFEASVGLDPGEAIRATATIRVLVDGHEQAVPGLPSLAAGKAVAIRVTLTGAKELTVISDFGSAGGVGSDVNWADARLVE